MHTFRRVAAATAALGCLAAGATAQAQHQGTRIDIIHCFVSEPSVVESPGAYRLQAYVLRGMTRASEPGGAFDNAATRCVGSSAAVAGSPAVSRGYCELATSPEDRAVAQYTIEAGQGSGSFISGTGRYKGISGETAFRPLPPVPTVEPGVSRVCNRTVGDFKLP